jgi:hypothetical protein
MAHVLRAKPPAPTQRARRSIAYRLAPAALVALGLLSLAIAAMRLDDVYARDPGVVRSWQLLPRPLATGHSDLQPLVDAGLDLFARSHLGHDICGSVWIDRVCKRRPPLPHPAAAGRRPLEQYGRHLFGRRASDVAVVSWQERRNRIVVVTVSRFETKRAAHAAVQAAKATKTLRLPSAGRSATPVARVGWLEGERLLVGVAVSAPTRAAAASGLAKDRSQVRTYVRLARVGWYEALALVPLILLLLAVSSMRLLLYFVVALLVLVVAVVGLVAALALLLLLPLAILRARLRRRSPDEVRAPADGPDWAALIRVQDLSEAVTRLEARGRSAALAATGLVAFGIATLTTSLLPASFVWGSVVVVGVAVYRPRAVAATESRVLGAMRKTLKTLFTLVLILLVLGLAPISLFADRRVQAVAVVLALVILVEHWRALTPESEVGYARWYDDIDTRSTLFLIGAAALTIGASAMFFGSTGDSNASAQLVDKVLGGLGLILVSTVVAHVRAARDAAARDRARRRGTPHVLYLRSFGDDKLRVNSPRHGRRGLEQLSWRRTELFEDVVARTLSSIGPVVAIARPGSGQSDLGAARDSIVADNWLDAVRTYMSNAALVAVVIGTSEGLVRELDALNELRLLNRVCVFIPPVDDDEVARRIEVLGRGGFYGAWRRAPDREARRRIVALTSLGGGQTVMVAKKRTATAFRAVGEELARRAAVETATPSPEPSAQAPA